MADETKGFPPSDYKLKRLREQGIVPKSRELMVFAAVTGLTAGIFLIRGGAAGRLVLTLKEFWVSPAQSGQELMQSAALSAVAFSFWLLLPVGAIVFIIGAFQTGFLVAGHLIGFDFGKPFQFAGRLRLRTGAAITGALCSAAWVAVCSLIVRRLLDWTKEVSDVNTALPLDAVSWLPAAGAASDKFLQGSGAVLEEGLARLSTVSLSVVGFSFFLGLVSRFAAVMAFRNEHSMSRAEIEAESRELESSPDVRRRIGELREQQ